MASVTAFDAKTRFGELLLRRVAGREEIVISRRPQQRGWPLRSAMNHVATPGVRTRSGRRVGVVSVRSAFGALGRIKAPHLACGDRQK